MMVVGRTHLGGLGGSSCRSHFAITAVPTRRTVVMQVSAAAAAGITAVAAAAAGAVGSDLEGVGLALASLKLGRLYF